LILRIKQEEMRNLKKKKKQEEEEISQDKEKSKELPK
jgi:hypothetical protein